MDLHTYHKRGEAIPKNIWRDQAQAPRSLNGDIISTFLCPNSQRQHYRDDGCVKALGCTSITNEAKLCQKNLLPLSSVLKPSHGAGRKTNQKSR
jgi:hypothetical protein